MGIRFAGLVAASMVLAAGTNAAHAVIIGFDDAPSGAFTTNYSEDGFLFTVTSGTDWGFTTSGAGNPGPSLQVGADSGIGIGDTITITAVGGLDIEFLGVEFASFDEGTQSDGVDIFGRVNGVNVASILDLNSDTDVFAEQSGFAAMLFDEVLIVGASLGDDSLLLDNFELVAVQSVPVPAPFLLLLAGMGAIWVTGRRRQTA